MTEQNYQVALKALVLEQQPLWWPVLEQWISRFGGWWAYEHDESRDPAWAIACQALRRDPLPTDAHRTAHFLAMLPFNRWHAATPTGRRWNPLQESFALFAARVMPEGVVTFVAPDFETLRSIDTVNWLWARWVSEYAKRMPRDSQHGSQRGSQW
ncbi:hypothetical protein [Paraburkholderia sp. HD33-4]|uniref:hypothetical protein n=1 Tax=Paraburkholderia sp. HD33-4 TaxID=2883242 RepID=UPI001F438E4C|nr:hypothetical protein [Paraburkholderia sp. HD33-4]